MRLCSRCSIQSSQRRTARCCSLEPDTQLRLAEGFSLTREGFECRFGRGFQLLHALSRSGAGFGSLLGFGSTSQARKADSEPDNEVPFTVGVIVLSAKMAKADGTVDADEVAAFEEIIKISAAEMKQVAPIFNSAKRDATNFETCAEQLVTVFNGNRKVS